MKHFTITIEGDCADDVPLDLIYGMAACAEVQVVEPEVHSEDDIHNPTRFNTWNVETKVEITP